MLDICARADSPNSVYSVHIRCVIQRCLPLRDPLKKRTRAVPDCLASAYSNNRSTLVSFAHRVSPSTVWIYLFFLPFQLIDLFGYYAILGVCIAAFIYLGLIAAGEEIEQPFGAYPPSSPGYPASLTCPMLLFSVLGYDEVRGSRYAYGSAAM